MDAPTIRAFLESAYVGSMKMGTRSAERMSLFWGPDVGICYHHLQADIDIWLWVKIKDLGDLRDISLSLVPSNIIGVPNFDPYPYYFTRKKYVILAKS